MKIHENKTNVIINGVTIKGHVDNEICEECGANQIYSESYNAFFCPKCNEWIDRADLKFKLLHWIRRLRKPIDPYKSGIGENDYSIFVGKWRDNDGKVLNIRKNEKNKLEIDFSKKAEYVDIVKLNSDKNKSIGLDSNYYSKLYQLDIELGESGIGAFLSLDYYCINNREYLRPMVSHGLIDEWEECFGVEWIFPVIDYFKVEDRS